MQFHAGNCPSCRNGRLFLFRESETGDVYGHCEECEQGYRSPEEIEGKSGFLTYSTIPMPNGRTRMKSLEVSGRTIRFSRHSLTSFERL